MCFIESIQNKGINMTIKLVATDIDGTILGYTEDFHQSVIDYIQELDNNGIKVVLVTGRMHKSAQKIADELGLKTPIVSYQGALVRNKEQVLYERYIPNETSQRILKWALKQDIQILETGYYLKRIITWLP